MKLAIFCVLFLLSGQLLAETQKQCTDNRNWAKKKYPLRLSKYTETCRASTIPENVLAIIPNSSTFDDSVGNTGAKLAAARREDKRLPATAFSAYTTEAKNAWLKEFAPVAPKSSDTSEEAEQAAKRERNKSFIGRIESIERGIGRLVATPAAQLPIELRGSKKLKELKAIRGKLKTILSSARNPKPGNASIMDIAKKIREAFYGCPSTGDTVDASCSTPAGTGLMGGANGLKSIFETYGSNGPTPAPEGIIAPAPGCPFSAYENLPWGGEGAGHLIELTSTQYNMTVLNFDLCALANQTEGGSLLSKAYDGLKWAVHAKKCRNDFDSLRYTLSKSIDPCNKCEPEPGSPATLGEQFNSFKDWVETNFLPNPNPQQQQTPTDAPVDPDAIYGSCISNPDGSGGYIDPEEGVCRPATSE